MNPSRLLQLVANNARVFTLCVAVGAAVALGLRSPGGIESAPPRAHKPAKEKALASDHPHAMTDPKSSADREDPETARSTGSSVTEARAVAIPEGPGSGTPDTGAVADGAGDTGVLLQLGNAVCPVMGGEPDGHTYTDWNGLRVDHCCAPCSERFLKNPESLLDEKRLDWRDAVKAAAVIDAASGEQRAALMASAAERWKVLRAPARTAIPADPAVGSPPSGLLVDLGNTACPVMGGEVDGETVSEWNGMRVNHCCAGCSKRFLKDPETLLDDVSIDWRQLRDALRKYADADEDDRSAALDAIRARWTVVREPAIEER